MEARLESRKLVTVVFSDLAGSTALGERLDPEVLAHVLAEYFERMAAVLTSYGGSVREFIGDAVMAVFGIPDLHEDDAERAVRASIAMTAGLEELNEELRATHGLMLSARTGINTGEILAGRTAAGQEMVLGDAINVAARLAAAAGEGETLIGEGTYRLVADLIDVETVEPVQVRGRALPVPAWRLVGERPHGARKRAPLIGRAEEIALIEQRFDVAVDSRETRVVALVGEPGIGKSRLIEEAMTSLEPRATILFGQCSSYGGSGLAHLAELVRSALSHEAGSRLMADPVAAFGTRSRMLVKVIAALSENGLPDAPKAETLWAVQRLVLALARRRPVVVVIEDVHLASGDAWELVRGLSRSDGDHPILVLLSARPELLASGEPWRGGADRLEIAPIGPLPDDAALSLVETIAGSEPSGRRGWERAVEVARGNPLFLREMTLEVLDGAVDRSAMLPRSIFALLSARLERLSPDERSVLSFASVIGATFDPGLLRGLGEGRPIDAPLRRLRERGLVEPSHDPSRLRFEHELLRDAAYGATPRRQRSALHERVAGALAATQPVDGSLVGYHYERAFRDVEELGIDDERSRRLAGLAARHLRQGGRTARDRGEAAVAADLLERSAGLAPVDYEEGLLGEVARANALAEIGRREDARRVLTGAREGAIARGLPRVRARAEIEDLHRRFSALSNEPAADARRLLPRVVRDLHRARDFEGLARAYLVASELAWYADHRPSRAEHHQRRAIRFAHLAGARLVEVALLTGLPSIWLHGTLPADEGLARCRELVATVGDETPLGELHTRTWLSGFEAMMGDLPQARATLTQARALADDLGLAGGLYRSEVNDLACFVEQVAGRFDLLEPLASAWRASYEGAFAEGVRAYATTTRARALVELGRLDEAESEARLVGASVRVDSPWFALAPAVRSVVAAERGAEDEAALLASEAIAQVDAGEFTVERARVRLLAARAFGTCDREGEALRAAEEAIQLFEAKGDVPETERARGLLERISNGLPASRG